MKSEKILVVQFRLSRTHWLLALALAFLCFHPRPLGSETLTLTTYYPAPYGGYVALLTTGKHASCPQLRECGHRDKFRSDGFQVSDKIFDRRRRLDSAGQQKWGCSYRELQSTLVAQ